MFLGLSVYGSDMFLLWHLVDDWRSELVGSRSGGTWIPCGREGQDEKGGDHVFAVGLVPVGFCCNLLDFCW